MKRLEMVQVLLHKAAQDEAVLETLVADPKFDDETVGFHAQQAVEKLLKAWLSRLFEKSKMKSSFSLPCQRQSIGPFGTYASVPRLLPQKA